MKLKDLDHHPATGNAAITNSLRWLETLLRQSAASAFHCEWSPEQRAAAEQALAEAKELMEANVEAVRFGAAIALNFHAAPGSETTIVGSMLISKPAEGAPA